MGSSCSSPSGMRVVAPIDSSKPFCLLEAAAEGDLKRLAALIDQKADVEQRNNMGRSALHIACSKGHCEAARLLIDYGASPSTKDCWGNDPLHDAVVFGHHDVVQILLQAGAVLTGELKTELEMKLFHLASRDDIVGIKNLVEKGGVSVCATDYHGRTALHIAAERGHIGLVEFFLSHSVDANVKDRQGETALSLAVAEGHTAVQCMLKRAGAVLSPNRRQERNRSMTASFAVMEAFPQPIAVAMLEGRKIEPISKENVSLFFSDIVGFTTISGTMCAAKVTRMLNSLFRKFDRLAYLHGIQKVDVIGDAYIAATNFMEDQTDDHAARLARFAVDVMTAARETPLDEDDELLGHVQLRAGMHCGPVSGSVVGNNNRKYTLMGDAVNTASRMESCGLAGRIQCSEASAALIAQQSHDIKLRPREGGVEVKGKGHMHTFWVSSVREGLRTFSSCPNLFHRPADAAAADADADAAADGAGFSTLPRSRSFDSGESAALFCPPSGGEPPAGAEPAAPPTPPTLSRASSSGSARAGGADPGSPAPAGPRLESWETPGKAPPAWHDEFGRLGSQKKMLLSRKSQIFRL